MKIRDSLNQSTINYLQEHKFSFAETLGDLFKTQLFSNTYAIRAEKYGKEYADNINTISVMNLEELEICSTGYEYVRGFNMPYMRNKIGTQEVSEMKIFNYIHNRIRYLRPKPVTNN
tara:strand:- start:731 stop:1081 length:351 start_codon:yes stop_codon:yes gene_type:complete